MIDPTKSLNELYSSLCIEQRRLSNTYSKGLWKCLNCDRLQKEHFDGRCSVMVTTPNFRAKESQETDRVLEALSLLEKILSL